MRASDSICHTLGHAGECRPTTAALLRFAKPCDEGALRRALSELCDAVPRLRQRIVPVPFDAAPPEWIDDEAFALPHHLHLVSAPNSASAFLADARRRLGLELREDRPLWHATYYNEAPGGPALLLVVHHSATDGAGIGSILGVLDGDMSSAFTPGSLSSLTPRLVTADALLWRAVQFGIEELGETADVARASLADTAASPFAAIGDVTRRASNALEALTTGIQGSRPGSTRKARRRSRRLVTFEIEMKQLDALAATVHTSPEAVVTALISTGLEAAWSEARREPLGLDVLLPMVATSLPHPSLVWARTGPSAQPPGRRLVELAGHLDRLDPEIEQRRYAVLARMLAGTPANIVRALGAAFGSRGNWLHLTPAGAARAIRFAGERVTAIHAFPPIAGDPPIALAAHVYRGRLHLGLDIDLHAAPDPAEVQNALHDTWASLRTQVQQLL